MKRVQQLSKQLTAAAPAPGTSVEDHPLVQQLKNDLNTALASESAKEKYSEVEWKLRVELAAAYRIAAYNGWDELIYNHITIRVPGDEEHFLINPFGLHFSEVTASSLLKIDLDGKVIDPGSTDLGYNIAGFVIHSALHSTKREDLQCVWHTHHPAIAGVMSLKCGMLPLCLESVSLWPKVSQTIHQFEGISVDT